MIRLSVPLIALMTIGCAPVVAQETPPVAQETPLPDPIMPVPSTCTGTNATGYLIGMHRSDRHVVESEAIRQAKAIRWISPGMAVTMDYRADRLNVKLDEKGVILSFSCG